MNANQMRQLSLHYAFPFKFFELLQFGAQQIFEVSQLFPGVFSHIKNANLLSVSRLYLRAHPEGGIRRDEFADYLVSRMEASDYRQISFDDLIEDYRFQADHYNPSERAPYWQTTPRFIEPEIMHQMIQAALKLHVPEKAEIYRFTNPNEADKWGLARIWEDLQHYLCIDRERKIIQVITSGFD